MNLHAAPAGTPASPILAVPRKHPVDDPPPVPANPVPPVDEPLHPHAPVDEPDEDEPADT